MRTTLIIIALVVLSFNAKAQDASLSSFIKIEGYVKFTDISRLPLPVKRNYHSIEKFFIANHIDKNNYYIESGSIKSDNNFLSIVIRQIDGLKKLKKREEQNLPPVVGGGLGNHDGTLVVNLRSGAVEFMGEE